MLCSSHCLVSAYGLSWVHGSSLKSLGNDFRLTAMNGTVHRHVASMVAAVLFYLWGSVKFSRYLVLFSVANNFQLKFKFMSLSRILLISKELSSWLHQYTNEAVFNNVLNREKWAICLLQQALDIEDGIVVLLEKNLPGAALALARPLFECYVRGVWLLNAATDDEIERFRSGEHYQEFGIFKLAKAIGNDAENEIINAHIKVMHDLTHGGTSHISARCFSGAIEPRYPEDNLISLVQLCIEVKIRSSVIILARMEKDEVLSLLDEKAENIRNSFQAICLDVSK